MRDMGGRFLIRLPTMETRSTLRLALNALVAVKSWGRKGRKGWAKIVAHRAQRRAGKASCRDTLDG